MGKSKYQHKTVEQIIDDLDIVKKVIDYHYEIEQEALKTDDIYGDAIVEFVADELAENDNDALEYAQYEKIANNIMDKIADTVADEICDCDRAAIEDEEERREAMKGNY